MKILKLCIKNGEGMKRKEKGYEFYYMHSTEVIISMKTTGEWVKGNDPIPCTRPFLTPLPHLCRICTFSLTHTLHYTHPNPLGMPNYIFYIYMYVYMNPWPYSSSLHIYIRPQPNLTTYRYIEQLALYVPYQTTN